MQSVTIADATPGATIYYTTNGTAPTTSSFIYNGAITVSTSETLEAIALAPNYTQSAVATASYTLPPTVATPVFSIAGGAYPVAQTVSISDITPGATIYYTTDGTLPTQNSPVYKNPIAVSSSTEIMAIAVESGYFNSALASAAYDITPLAVGSALDWTWMGGSSTLNCWSEGCGVTGVYGTLGAPGAGNVPSGRNGAGTWTDSSGNFWVFGGAVQEANGSNGELNDLWEFNPHTNQWTWMGGSTTFPCETGYCGVPGVYGEWERPPRGTSLAAVRPCNLDR